MGCSSMECCSQPAHFTHTPMLCVPHSFPASSTWSQEIRLGGSDDSRLLGQEELNRPHQIKQCSLFVLHIVPYVPLSIIFLTRGVCGSPLPCSRKKWTSCRTSECIPEQSRWNERKPAGSWGQEEGRELVAEGSCPHITSYSLSPPKREREHPSLSFPWCETGFSKKWGDRPESIVKYINSARRGGGEKWQDLLSLMGMLHHTC